MNEADRIERQRWACRDAEASGSERVDTALTRPGRVDDFGNSGSVHSDFSPLNPHHSLLSEGVTQF